MRWALGAAALGARSRATPQVLDVRGNRVLVRAPAERLVAVDLDTGRIVGAADGDGASAIRVATNDSIVGVGELRTTVLS